MHDKIMGLIKKRRSKKRKKKKRLPQNYKALKGERQLAERKVV